MTRPLRIDVEDGLYHVTSRGWERRPIVRDDRDRKRWLDLLERVATRCGWRVFAWALMRNHHHLYLRTPQPNLSAGMHDLNSGYASGFNRRWRRCGSLFQGRFKAVLVEDQSHAVELSRYVHLNPVRASVVERPEEYAWSSYPDYLAMRRAPAWLDWETVLGELGKRVTDEAVGAIGAYFGGVSTAAVSKTVAGAENRRPTDSAWDRRLTQLSEQLTTRGEARDKLHVKT